MLHHYAHKERPLISSLILAIWVVFSLSSMLYASSQVTTIPLTILAPTENTGSTSNWGGIGWGEVKEWCDGDNNEDDIWCNEDTDDTIDNTIDENTDTNNIDGNINTNPEITDETHGAAQDQPKDVPIFIKKPSISEVIVDKEAIIPPVDRNEELANYGCVLPAPSFVSSMVYDIKNISSFIPRITTGTQRTIFLTTAPRINIIERILSHTPIGKTIENILSKAENTIVYIETVIKDTIVKYISSLFDSFFGNKK